MIDDIIDDFDDFDDFDNTIDEIDEAMKYIYADSDAEYIFIRDTTELAVDLLKYEIYKSEE